MGKLYDFLFESAKKRWSLLFLFAIPALFLFAQKYFDLSFREAVWDWRLWIPAAVLFILSGILDRVKFPQKWHSLWPSGLLILCGGVLIAGGFWQLKPTILPKDRLVVAIASFTPISDGAKEEAANLSHRIEKKLGEKKGEGIPLEVWRLSDSIPYGSDERTRRKWAIAACKAKAHVILWGDVRREEGELFVEPRLTVVRNLQEASIEERKISPFESIQPEHLEFKKRLTDQIAEIVTLVFGLAYYKIGNWNRAIEILEHVKSDDGYLYQALCLYERAQRSTNPQPDLRAAVETYKKIPWNPRLPPDALAWTALLNRANAVAYLGLSSSAKESQSYFREAVEAYRAALQVYTRAELPQQWAMTQNNLGNALGELGTRVGGEEGKGYLSEAVTSFDNALLIYDSASFPERHRQILGARSRAIRIRNSLEK